MEVGEHRHHLSASLPACPVPHNVAPHQLAGRFAFNYALTYHMQYVLVVTSIAVLNQYHVHMRDYVLTKAFDPTAYVCRV